MEDEPLASHASSHFSLDPVPGSVLLEQEVVRRDGLNQRGNITTGCRELDDGALLGGFERGCVVGLSAEDEEIGLLVCCRSEILGRFSCFLLTLADHAIDWSANYCSALGKRGSRGRVERPKGGHNHYPFGQCSSPNSSECHQEPAPG